MSPWVWMDGGLVPSEAATVPVTDRGLLLGDGVFETCKVVDGEPFALRRHLERLRHSAALVGIELPWTDDDLRSACRSLIRAVTDGTGEGPEPLPPAPARTVGRLRITLTRGATAPEPGATSPSPMLLVTASPAPGHPPTVDVVTVSWVVNERSPLVGAKTTSRAESVMALLHAQALGADEAIQANSVGALCEGTTCNVFVVVDGRLCTPALGTGCLGGVTRALVCESVDVAERDDLTLDDLRRAPEAFVTSSTRGVTPIAHVDGRALRSSPGPLTVAAATAFSALVARSLDP